MLKKLFGTLFGAAPTSPAAGSADGFFLDVRCGECGETFHLFINTSHDLFQEFQPDGSVTYRLKKRIIGTGCRNQMQVLITFDRNKRETHREIEGGAFIDAAD